MSTARRSASVTADRAGGGPGAAVAGARKPLAAKHAGRKSTKAANRFEQPTPARADTVKPGIAKPDAGNPARPKQKLVRDSFTMPKADFALIEILKNRTLTFKRPTKKSELLRAGLHALMALPDARLGAALDGLAPLKAGRPRKTA